MEMGGRLTPELKAIVVIDRTGWTHEEYQEQPEWLVDALIAKWSAEAESRNRATKQR